MGRTSPMHEHQTTHHRAFGAQPESWLPNLLLAIQRSIGQMEARQQEHQTGSASRMSDLRVHIDSKIDDLGDGLHNRMDRIEDRVGRLENRRSEQWWKQLPWMQISGLAIVGVLSLLGHISASEIKALLLKLAGL